MLKATLKKFCIEKKYLSQIWIYLLVVVIVIVDVVFEVDAAAGKLLKYKLLSDFKTENVLTTL
jgi:hypothetical protein